MFTVYDGEAETLEILLHGFNCDPVFERHLLNIDFSGLLRFAEVHGPTRSNQQGLGGLT